VLCLYDVRYQGEVTGDIVQHGNIPAATSDGTEIHEFSLKPGERIASVTARSGWMLDQLTFTTDKHRVIGPFGGEGGGVTEHSVPDQHWAYLAYLKGRVDMILGDTAVRHLDLVWAY